MQKPPGPPRVRGDAHTDQYGSEPFSETLERTKASELHRQDSRMRVLPAGVPDLCQRADFRHLGLSYDHRGHRLLRLDQRDQFADLAIRAPDSMTLHFITFHQ